MRKSLKLSLLVAVLAVCSWIGPGQADAAYKYCYQMTNCSPNGAWSACWSSGGTGELFRCFCVNGRWDCSYP